MHSIIAYLSAPQYQPSPLQHPLKQNTPKLIKNKAKQTHLALLDFQHLLIHPSVIGCCSVSGSITFCPVAPPTKRSYVPAQGLWHTIIAEPSLKLLLDFLLLQWVLESLWLPFCRIPAGHRWDIQIHIQPMLIHFLSSVNEDFGALGKSC